MNEDLERLLEEYEAIQEAVKQTFMEQYDRKERVRSLILDMLLPLLPLHPWAVAKFAVERHGACTLKSSNPEARKLLDPLPDEVLGYMRPAPDVELSYDNVDLVLYCRSAEAAAAFIKDHDLDVSCSHLTQAIQEALGTLDALLHLQGMILS